uniref:Uncharacterized protein n=1 Tax=Gopherus evgoodei TaxID=1825980 RepID=A0A8C4WHN3_9SAUR
MKRLSSLLLLLVLLKPFTCHPAGRNEKEIGSNKLLLVSFDGFRWNYDQDAKYITPPSVTMTSPSHFTTITDNFEWHNITTRKIKTSSPTVIFISSILVAPAGWI